MIAGKGGSQPGVNPRRESPMWLDTITYEATFLATRSEYWSARGKFSWAKMLENEARILAAQLKPAIEEKAMNKNPAKQSMAALQAKAKKLYTKSEALWAKGNVLWANGNVLRAEANTLQGEVDVLNVKASV